MKTLIFIPTYNERENAPLMCEQTHKLNLDADVLFMDDASPDGTGRALEEIKQRFPRLNVVHRTGKLGIGSAHAEAIQLAYDRGYQLLVTMDCDFTHSPSDIPRLIAAAQDADIAVGSRWLQKGSLPGWNLFRRMTTWLGHWLTFRVLGLRQDASGAFRAYRLDRLPREVFGIVRSRGYSFFFESLFILNRNGFNISEIPITLPVRTYGHSKMSMTAAMRSARYIFELWLAHLRKPETFLLSRLKPEIDPALVDPQQWDDYWQRPPRKSNALYEVIAGIYRRAIIRRNLVRAVRRTFVPGASLLHTGCGGGQVDVDLHGTWSITAIDISPGALALYCRNNPQAAGVRHGDIFHLPFEAESFDGIYNLGVLEHFTREELMRILREFHRVLKPGGKMLAFWPHRHGSSVIVLDFAHWLLRACKRPAVLHPPEITRFKSKKETATLMAETGFALSSCRFGPSDFFVQAVVVAEKK